MVAPAAALAFPAVMDALHESRARLVEATSGLDAASLSASSFDREWTIAQVLSHLGSGAEIFGLFVDAGLGGEPAPGLDHWQAVWDRWDALSVERQASDGLASDARLLDRLDSLGSRERAGWRVEMFGEEQTLAGLARMRLSEHALHTWDIAVTADRGAVLTPSAVDLLVDTLPALAARVGRPAAQSRRIAVATSAPDRSFVLAVGPDGTRIDEAAADQSDAVAGSLSLSAEALIRLVCGRLDEAHTPRIQAHDVDLDALRRVFPGL